MENHGSSATSDSGRLEALGGEEGDEEVEEEDSCDSILLGEHDASKYCSGEDEEEEEGETVRYIGQGQVLITIHKKQVVDVECPCIDDECKALIRVGNW